MVDPNTNTTPDDYDLEAVSIQLRSQRPGDLWKGMEQVTQWLQDNPESPKIYEMLLNSVHDNRALRERVRKLLIDVSNNNKSKAAQSALHNLPSSVRDLLADADDAYYAGQYGDAIELYRQVLKLDPKNMRAQDHLAKAEIKQIAGESDTDLPKAAVQYYRRARSFIAAREVATAVNLLTAAIESAKAKGMVYDDAEQALNNMQNLLIADEFIEKAKIAIEKNQRKNAIEYYEKALKLDPTNVVIKKKLSQQQMLLNTSILMRWIVAAAMLIISGFMTFQFLGQRFGASTIIPTFSTNAPIATFSDTDIPIIVAITTDAKQTITITPTSTPTVSPEPVPTNTEAPTSTPTLPPLGVGYVTKAIASTWNTPNGTFIEKLGLYQVITILEKVLDHGFTWYRCSWEINGEIKEGWILAEYISFGSPPK